MKRVGFWLILASLVAVVMLACGVSAPKAVDCRVEFAAMAREGGCVLPRDDAGRE